VAGGFVAPLLRDAGWEVTFVSRNRAVVDSVNEGGGLWVRTTEDSAIDRWIGGVSAVSLHDHELPRLATRADLLATSVGPSALPAVGKALAPLLCARVASSDSPINIVTFENHRRAPEILATSLMREDSSLAGKICRRVGIGGAVVWRAISRRTITDGGLRFEADVTSECYADALPLVPGAAPLDGSIPGISLVRAFDDRMVEKLWVFNAGHAAAAYLGWRAGLATLGEAMSDPEISASVAGVVVEAQQAFEAYLNTRLASASIPQRPLYSILDRYADPALADPVTRVARDPRRKLAAGDRLVGPGTACLAAGIRPGALATASAAAVAYSEESDPQAVDLQRELKLLGPEEVLATVSTLHPQDEFVRLVCESYENLSGRQETEAGPPITTYSALGRVRC
jgi:mannitol-1-phosphate 5-dehydrogenase